MRTGAAAASVALTAALALAAPTLAKAPPVPLNDLPSPAPPPATTVAPRPTVAAGTSYPRPSFPFPPLPDAAATPCPHPVATIAKWPLRRRVAQLVMLGADSSALASVRKWVADERIGGIALRGFPSSSASLVDGIAALKAAAPDLPPFVGVDEEGGRVQVLRPITGSLPSARRLATQYTTEQVRKMVAEHFAKVKALGVDLVFGPVLDVTGDRTGVIGDRSFSGDPAVVAEYGQAWADGLRDAGILPVLKHFPGHGLTGGDSHSARVATRPYAELKQTDLPPFRTVLGGGGPVAVMVGHLEVPGLTGDIPSSVSDAAITRLLRKQYGFRGLVLTDSLAMAAVNIRWSPPNVAVAAIAAGADVALFVTIGDAEAKLTVDFLEAAVKDGRIPEAQLNRSVLHVVRAKGLNPCAVKLDKVVPSAGAGAASAGGADTPTTAAVPETLPGQETTTSRPRR